MYKDQGVIAQPEIQPGDNRFNLLVMPYQSFPTAVNSGELVVPTTIMSPRIRVRHSHQ